MNKKLEKIAVNMIEEENGVYKGYDVPLSSCELDSFGYTMVLIELTSKFNVLKENEKLEVKLDLQTVTLADIERLINEND